MTLMRFNVSPPEREQATCRSGARGELPAGD
jgi:hypothetical protein